LRSKGAQIRWKATTSGPGLSRGRNVALRLASAPLVGFPDDNCWYPPETLQEVIRIFEAEPALIAVSGQQRTLDGRPSMLRWAPRSTLVTRRNFLRTTISSTLFVRRMHLDRVGHFDESMGVGSESWYGAGEDSDVVLRLLGLGAAVRYEPCLTVLQDEPRDEIDNAYREKMLRYGCGNGHLWRIHRLPAVQLLWNCARKFCGTLMYALGGRVDLALANFAYIRGTWAGYRDRPPRDLSRRVTW
jgi:hypothetical protein